MAGRLLDEDPELAYLHAQAAVRRAGRVDVVREAAGLTAYRTGRYAEALRELRTVRRLNASDEHIPLMADCERGLGRPDRAIAMAQEEGARALPPELQVELALVLSGARLDLEDTGAALAALDTPVVKQATGLLAARVTEARATALAAAGRHDEAEAALASLPADYRAAMQPDEEVVVFDLEDERGDGADSAGQDVPGAGADPAGQGERTSEEGDGTSRRGGGTAQSPGGASAGDDSREGR